MGGSARCHHAAQVPGHNDVRIGAADTFLGSFAERVHSTGTHDTDPAAQSQVTVSALGLLGLKPLPHGFHLIFFRLLQKQLAILRNGEILKFLIHLSLLMVESAISQGQLCPFCSG